MCFFGYTCEVRVGMGWEKQPKFLGVKKVPIILWLINQQPTTYPPQVNKGLIAGLIKGKWLISPEGRISGGGALGGAVVGWLAINKDLVRIHVIGGMSIPLIRSSKRDGHYMPVSFLRRPGGWSNFSRILFKSLSQSPTGLVSVCFTPPKTKMTVKKTTIWTCISYYFNGDFPMSSRWWFQIFFIFTPKIGEIIQFDEHIFQMGWFNHHLVLVFSGVVVFCPSFKLSRMALFMIKVSIAQDMKWPKSETVICCI